MSLWREHLGTFLSDESMLTPAQRGIVQVVLADFDLYFDPATRTSADSSLRSSLDGVFTPVHAAAIFATLGPSTTIVIAGNNGVSVDGPNRCECSRNSNYCWTSYCTSSNCESGSGCGTFGQYECNGRCGGAGPDPE